MQRAPRYFKRTPKQRFNISLTTDGHHWLAELSRQENRSMSNMLEMLVIREAERAKLTPLTKEAA